MKKTREEINEYLGRLQNGEDCLKEFIDYSRGYIQYIAYKYSIDKSLTEDVVFSAYDKILSAISTFDMTKNGLAWLAKITQNEAYAFNREEAGNEIPLDECRDVLIDESSGGDEEIAKFDLERAIARLDGREQAIIEYKVFMGMTVREIAHHMSIPKSTVAYVLKCALKKIEKFLE